MEKVDGILKKYGFHFELKKEQREVIANILSKMHTVGILPTGYGKSMCYVLPPLLIDGISLVISPLRSLMMTQAQQLKDRGIKCIFVTKTSEMTSEDKQGLYLSIY